MRAIRFIRRAKAFTLIELLCVIAMIAILAALLLPVINQAKARAQRVACINNLRQVGVAFQGFAHDHNGQFPMQVSATAGGSAEFSLTSYRVAGEFYFSFRHFQVLSNDLVSPKLLICPADTRLPATNFALLKNENLSYFVGLSADYVRPNSILAGDRNLTNDYETSSTMARPRGGLGWRWTSELHQFKGNLLFSDAHVEEKSSQALAVAFNQSQFASDLSLPAMPRAGTPNRNFPSFAPTPVAVAGSKTESISEPKMMEETPGAKTPTASAVNQPKPEVSTSVTRQLPFSAVGGAEAQVVTKLDERSAATSSSQRRSSHSGPRRGPWFLLFSFGDRHHVNPSGEAGCLAFLFAHLADRRDRSDFANAGWPARQTASQRVRFVKVQIGPGRYAFARRDLMTVVLMCCLLGVLIIVPSMQRLKARSQRIQCTDNLKQIGLAFKTWALDCGDSFPMSVKVKNGGSQEYIETGEVFRHFQVMSNEFGNPKVLICPADVRQPADDSSKGFGNTNLSYFVGVDAHDTNPQMFLSGDRHLTNGPLTSNRLLVLSTNSAVGWTHEMHRFQGNVGLADGSVQQYSRARLAEALRNCQETNRLAIP